MSSTAVPLANEAPAPPLANNLPALTSARAFAATLVVAYHLRGMLGDLPRIPGALLEHGNLSVPFFFILSGFILAYTNFALRGQTEVAKRPFYAARFARIYPVYFVSLVFGLATFLSRLTTTGNPNPTVTAVKSVPVVGFLLQTYWPSPAVMWNTPAWSLAVEALFYALFPFVAPRLYRLGVRASWLALSACLLGAWLVPKLVLAFYSALHSAGALAPTPELNDMYVGQNPLSSLPITFAGVCLCRLYVDARKNPRWVGIFQNPGLMWGGLALIYGLMFTGRTFGYAVPILMLAFSAIILHLATKRSGLLCAPLLVLLGEASFSLYILHDPLLRSTKLIFERIPNATVQFWGVLLTLIALSVVSFFFIETPSRKFLRRRAKVTKPG